MTQLKSLAGMNPVRATSVEGVFMRPVNFKLLDNMREFFEEVDAEKEGTKTILWAFENLFCDEAGEPFSDISERTIETLDIATCNRLMADVQTVLVPPNSEGDQLDS